jgi:hypothetical protein
MIDEYVDIIVVGYRISPAITKIERKCLSSVIHNTTHPFILTYFDNYDTGLSLTEAWNSLIRRSDSEYICLLNNDTEVSPLWLSKMRAGFDVQHVGFVGPSTNQCHSPQKTIPTFKQADAIPDSDANQIMPEPISGFCLMFKKETWIKLGGFDTRYGLYGQESDFIDRAQRELGLHCLWRKDAFVFHRGETSVKASNVNVDKERTKAKELYWQERRK